MILHRFPDRGTLLAALAEGFLEAGRAALAARGVFRAALAGGSTPRGLHAELVRPERRQRLDWSRVALYLGDERWVPPAHPDSNARMVTETLLAPLGLPDATLRRPPTGAGEPAEAARAYQRRIAADCGVPADGPPPVLDWIGLGLGADAHLASLFPGSPALAERRAWVATGPGPGGRGVRLTFTLPLIAAARHRAFAVSGGDKADALARTLETPADAVDPAALPAAELRENSDWWVDEAAAARLG